MDSTRTQLRRISESLQILAITIDIPELKQGSYLVKEPFVAGADTLIDTATEQLGIKNADGGFPMLFSATPFPGDDLHLTWAREETGGNVYCWNEHNMEGWLCPELLKYFDVAPEGLWVQLKSAG